MVFKGRMIEAVLHPPDGIAPPLVVNDVPHHVLHPFERRLLSLGGMVGYLYIILVVTVGKFLYPAARQEIVVTLSPYGRQAVQKFVEPYPLIENGQRQTVFTARSRKSCCRSAFGDPISSFSLVLSRNDAGKRTMRPFTISRSSRNSGWCMA